MSLTDYTSIQTAIQTWLARTGDTNISGNAADLIVLAEQRIFYGSGEGQADPLFSQALRVRQMETSADVTISAQTASLPTGWLSGRRFYISGQKALNFLPATDFWGKYLSATSGTPVAYTVEGGNFVFGPSPDATYTGKVLYYAKPDPLATTATNSVLSAFPGIYLDASLLEAAILEMDDAMAARYAVGLRSRIAGAMRSDKADRHSGAVLTMISDTGNP